MFSPPRFELGTQLDDKADSEGCLSDGIPSTLAHARSPPVVAKRTRAEQDNEENMMFAARSKRSKMRTEPDAQPASASTEPACGYSTVSPTEKGKAKEQGGDPLSDGSSHMKPEVR
jgi:hypothetical protein